MDRSDIHRKREEQLQRVPHIPLVLARSQSSFLTTPRANAMLVRDDRKQRFKDAGRFSKNFVPYRPIGTPNELVYNHVSKQVEVGGKHTRHPSDLPQSGHPKGGKNKNRKNSGAQAQATSSYPIYTGAGNVAAANGFLEIRKHIKASEVRVRDTKAGVSLLGILKSDDAHGSPIINHQHSPSGGGGGEQEASPAAPTMIPGSNPKLPALDMSSLVPSAQVSIAPPLTERKTNTDLAPSEDTMVTIRRFENSKHGRAKARRSSMDPTKLVRRHLLKSKDAQSFQKEREREKERVEKERMMEPSSSASHEPQAGDGGMDLAAQSLAGVIPHMSKTLLDPAFQLSRTCRGFVTSRQHLKDKLDGELQRLDAERLITYRRKYRYFRPSEYGYIYDLERMRLESQREALEDSLSKFNAHEWFLRLVSMVMSDNNLGSAVERQILFSIRDCIASGGTFEEVEFFELCEALNSEEHRSADVSRIIQFLLGELGISMSAYQSFLIEKRYPLPEYVRIAVARTPTRKSHQMRFVPVTAIKSLPPVQ